MLMLDRRMLLRAGSAATGAAALAATTTVPALPHAPQAGKQAQPSFYRFKLGTIEITVISDGSVAFPAETLWGDRAERTPMKTSLHRRSNRGARGACCSAQHHPRQYRRQAGVEVEAELRRRQVPENLAGRFDWQPRRCGLRAWSDIDMILLTPRLPLRPPVGHQ